MKKNPSEREIQEFIWNKKENWTQLIEEIDFPVIKEFKDEASITSIQAKDLLYNIIIQKLKKLDDTIRSIELIGMEAPLIKEGDSTIRVDFLGIIPGAPGISIIELKKNNRSARSALTQLLGYSNHLNMKFNTHSKDDLILVLISTMKERIVREAFLQSLIFDDKMIYALEPKFGDKKDLKSLKLSPWVPKDSDVRLISEEAFAKRNFDVYKIVWQGVPDEWNEIEKGCDPSEFQKARMNIVSTIAAQFMESKGIHGFVYSSQAWPELCFPYPNSLILVGLNPYKVTNAMLYKKENENIKMSEIPEISDYGYTLEHLISGSSRMRKNIEEEFNDNSNIINLDVSWASHLFLIGQKVVKTMLMNTAETIGTDGGFMDWASYEANFIENIYCHNYDISPTGMIRELFWEFLKISYDYMSKEKNRDHPICDDIEKWAIDSFKSHSFFGGKKRLFFTSPNLS